MRIKRVYSNDTNEESERQCNNRPQRHTHEFLGSTKLAEEGEDRHNHRFAGVSGEAITIPGGNHVHKIRTNTDFLAEDNEGHFHEIEVFTCPAISVGNGKHIHFVHNVTTCNDDHRHEFQFATLIESPLTPIQD